MEVEHVALAIRTLQGHRVDGVVDDPEGTVAGSGESVVPTVPGTQIDRARFGSIRRVHRSGGFIDHSHELAIGSQDPRLQ